MSKAKYRSVRAYNAFRWAIARHLGVHFNDLTREQFDEYSDPDHPEYEVIAIAVKEREERIAWKEGTDSKIRHAEGSSRGGRRAAPMMREYAARVKLAARFFGIKYHDALILPDVLEAFDRVPDSVKQKRFAELDRDDVIRKRALGALRERMYGSRIRKNARPYDDGETEALKRLDELNRAEHAAALLPIGERIARVCADAGIDLPARYTLSDE